MPIFELTAEQESALFAELIEAEKHKHNGVIFAQIYLNTDKKAVCRAHYVRQEKAAEIKMILGRQ